MLKDLCQADLRDRRFEVAVLPIGATEVHGMHLPFGVDTYNVEDIARRGAERALAQGAEVLVLPAIPYGMDANLMDFPYTIDIRPATLMALIGDVVRSVAVHGIRKAMLLNGHGGNTGVVEAAARELYGKVDCFVCRLDWWRVAEDVARDALKSTDLEHACEFETSVSLLTIPGLTHMEHARPGATQEHKLPTLTRHSGKFSRPWRFYTADGGMGRPDWATAEKGRRIVEATVERLAAILVELASAVVDDKFPY